MSQVILISFFNSNNIGDLQIADYFRSVFEKEHEVLCASHEGTFHIVGEYINDELSVWDKAKQKIHFLFDRVYYSPTFKVFIERYVAELKKSQMVVIGGGNILMDYTDTSKSYLKIREYIKYAKKEGKVCTALSVGIGPFYNDEQTKKAVNVLNQCDYISFRDKYSYNLFINNGGNKDIATVGIDPVFSLEYKADSKRRKDAIAINIISPRWRSLDYQKKVKNGYHTLIREVAAKNSDKHIILYATEANDNRDMQEIYASVSMLDNVHMELVDSYEKLRMLYEKSQIVIGARMHSLIIAYALHTPVIGLSWSEKVDAFFEIIERGDSVIKIEELNDSIEKIMNFIADKNVNWNFESVKERAKELLDKDIEEIRNNEAK